MKTAPYINSFKDVETLYKDSLLLLQTLIRTPSESGQERKTADLIQSFLSNRTITVNRVKNNIWTYNSFFSASKPTILLNSHHDTVKPNAGYTRDPFEAIIKQETLYGLGANDAGGCLVSMIATFLYYYDQPDLPFNLCLAATAEEENSGENGIHLVLDHLGSIAFALIGEPTGMQMAIAEKGNMVLDCVVYGKAGHAAREEGDNAIYKALKDIQWFEQYRFAKHCQFLGPTKMTVTQVNGGIQHNVVPAVCHFTVDIRLTSAYTVDEILDIIKSNISGDVSVRAGIMKPSSISMSHPVVKAGLALGMKTYTSPTCSDQGWLDIPSLKMGPGDSARSHMADEYIYTWEIWEGIKGYITLLDTLLPFLLNNPTEQLTEQTFD